MSYIEEGLTGERAMPYSLLKNFKRLLYTFSPRSTGTQRQPHPQFLNTGVFFYKIQKQNSGLYSAFFLSIYLRYSLLFLSEI